MWRNAKKNFSIFGPIVIYSVLNVSNDKIWALLAKTAAPAHAHAPLQSLKEKENF